MLSRRGLKTDRLWTPTNNLNNTEKIAYVHAVFITIIHCIDNSNSLFIMVRGMEWSFLG